MRYILSTTNDPYFNLAAEEYIIENVDENLFYIYQNQSSVIIGKNQNPFVEVDCDYLIEKGILLVRRTSGGGAVYQDLGNINYSFLLKNQAKNLYNFQKYSQIIIDVLNPFLKSSAYFGGRNDIQIDNKKISGAAQFTKEDNLIHHGTLIFDLDLKNINKILTPHYQKLTSKGVKSVSARVAKIKDYLKDPKLSKEELIAKLIIGISNQQIYHFNQEELAKINQIAKKKREAIEFLLQKRKKYQYQINEYLPGFGGIQIYFNLLDNRFSEFEIFGEYFGENETKIISKKFINAKYEEKAIEKIIEEIDNFESYFYNLTRKKLLTLILQQKND